MTTIKDETHAPRCQRPFAYRPTVREPLPRELEDLVFELVPLGMHKRGSGAQPADDSQSVRAAPLAQDPLFINRFARWQPYQRR
jgi:hypothetical protein